MNRIVKPFILVILAGLALGAIGASAASASQIHSEVESTKYTITGDGNQVFATAAGTVTCTGMSAESTTTISTPFSLTVTNIKYTGSGSEGKCITKTIFGNLNVVVDFATDGCDYVLWPGNTADITCLKAGGITISGPGCSITLKAVTNLGAVFYDNKETGTKRDVTATASLSGLKGTASGFLCSKEGEFLGASYSGNFTIQGFEDRILGAQVGVWVE